MLYDFLFFCNTTLSCLPWWRQATLESVWTAYLCNFIAGYKFIIFSCQQTSFYCTPSVLFCRHPSSWSHFTLCPSEYFRCLLVYFLMSIVSFLSFQHIFLLFRITSGLAEDSNWRCVHPQQWITHTCFRGYETDQWNALLPKQSTDSQYNTTKFQINTIW